MLITDRARDPGRFAPASRNFVHARFFSLDPMINTLRSRFAPDEQKLGFTGFTLFPEPPSLPIPFESIFRTRALRLLRRNPATTATPVDGLPHRRNPRFRACYYNILSFLI
jgi:hypothetical protein